MRHQVAGRKLGRKSAHRKAMFKNMVSSLIEHGRISTTLPRAKELRRIADQMITLGKQKTLHARRQAFDILRNRDLVGKLFDQLAPAFEKRNGGYTRIYQLGHRVGDAAKMAMIEYLQEDLLTAKVEGKITDGKDAKKAKKKAKGAKAAKAKAEKPKKEAKAVTEASEDNAKAAKPKKAKAAKKPVAKKEPKAKKA